VINFESLTGSGVPIKLPEQFMTVWERKNGCQTEEERQVYRQIRQILDDNHDYSQYPENEYLKVGADKHRARICGQAFRSFNSFIPGHDPENSAMDELTERLTREQERRDFG
jgi:hypothetical protein